MIEIIATAAVSGIVGAAATAFGFIHQRDWRVTVLGNTVKARDHEIDCLKAQSKNDKIWLDERSATIAALEAKLRAAGRALGEALAERDKASAALTAEKARDSARTAKGNRTRKINRLAREAAAAGGWIDWAGGECPVPDGTRCQIRFRSGYEPMDDASPEGWRWDHRGGISDIIAYRIVSAEQREAA